MFLPGVPADTPAGGNRYSQAIWPGHPAFPGNDEEELLRTGRCVPITPSGPILQAGQTLLAVAGRDAGGVDSRAAVPADITPGLCAIVQTVLLVVLNANGLLGPATSSTSPPA